MIMDFENQYRDKKVAFIGTKNLNYIRNSQEIDLLRRNCMEITVIGSNHKNYFIRIIYVWFRVLFFSFRRFDIVFVGFAPQLICPFFAWKLPTSKVHIDFFISLYDTFVNDRKACAPGSIPARVLRYLDRRTIAGAAHIICDTKAHADYFAVEFDAEKEKESVLYLQANPDIYYPRTAGKPQERTHKYTVLYFGSILPLQGVEVILESIRLIQDNKDIHFQMIGPVKDRAKEGIADAEFIPWLEERKLAEYIAAADLCLAGHFNAGIEKAKRTIPGKAYIYEAMEKPMILGENPANRELFVEDQKHYFVEMGNAEALAQKIVECYEMNRL